MKSLLIGLTSIALLTSPVAMAQSDQHRGQRGENPQHQVAKQHEGRQWHKQSGRWDNGRHRGWGRERGHNYHWGRGQQMGYNDWSRAQRVDYRRYNLRQPPRGYEWRRNDDRFILASVASGMIVSVIMRGVR